MGGGGGDTGETTTPAPSPTPAPVEDVIGYLSNKVQGINYTVESETTSSQRSNTFKKTGINGQYLYQEGDTIKFYLGNAYLGMAPAERELSLYTLDGGFNYSDSMLGLTKLLITLDNDQDSSNGINLIASMDTIPADLEFDNQAQLAQLLVELDITTSLASTEVANTFINNYLSTVTSSASTENLGEIVNFKTYKVSEYSSSDNAICLDYDTAELIREQNESTFTYSLSFLRNGEVVDTADFALPHNRSFVAGEELKTANQAVLRDFYSQSAPAIVAIRDIPENSRSFLTVIKNDCASQFYFYNELIPAATVVLSTTNLKVQHINCQGSGLETASIPVFKVDADIGSIDSIESTITNSETGATETLTKTDCEADSAIVKSGSEILVCRLTSAPLLNCESSNSQMTYRDGFEWSITATDSLGNSKTATGSVATAGEKGNGTDNGTSDIARLVAGTYDVSTFSYANPNVFPSCSESYDSNQLTITTQGDTISVALPVTGGSNDCTNGNITFDYTFTGEEHTPLAFETEYSVTFSPEISFANKDFTYDCFISFSGRTGLNNFQCAITDDMNNILDYSIGFRASKINSDTPEVTPTPEITPTPAPSTGEAAGHCVTLEYGQVYSYTTDSYTHLLNNCSYEIEVYWCHSNTSIVGGSGSLCGVDTEKYYQKHTTLAAGEKKANQYSIPDNSDISWAACKGGFFSFDQFDGEGGYSCK